MLFFQGSLKDRCSLSRLEWGSRGTNQRQPNIGGILLALSVAYIAVRERDLTERKGEGVNWRRPGKGVEKLRGEAKSPNPIDLMRTPAPGFGGVEWYILSKPGISVPSLVSESRRVDGAEIQRKAF